MKIRFFIRDTSGKEKWKLHTLQADLVDGRNFREKASTGIMLPAEIWNTDAQTVRMNTTYDLRQTKETDRRIKRLRSAIEQSWDEATQSGLTVEKGWLRGVIDRFNGEETRKAPVQKPVPASDVTDCVYGQLFERFLCRRDISQARKDQYRVLQHILHRYSIYLELSGRSSGTLTAAYFTPDTLQEFHDYVIDERRIYKKYQQVFKLREATTNLPRERGENFTSGLMKKFHSLIRYCIEEERSISEDPFDKYHIKPEIYATPYYLTKDEVETIYNHDYSRKPHLRRICDLFVFQCMTGPRVSDMWRFTEENVSNGCLQYIPEKTLHGEGRSRVITVPLNRRAMEIIERYRDEEKTGYSRKGMLLPLISQIKYNVYIKEVLKEAGITRTVVTYDSKGGKEKLERICDKASSHMARRTFIGNLYQKVADPNLIASMSGHCENSRSFSRYREISLDQKKDLVGLLDD